MNDDPQADSARALQRRKQPTVPIFFPDWLLVREISSHVRESLAAVGKGRLLDVGCGEKPYEFYRPAGVGAWIGFDVPENELADAHGYADSLPFESGTFDTILCTEVLEHVAEPAAAVAEFHRVLAPGGHVILTAPLYFPVHEEPYDFFRYTPYGLAHLFGKAGFDIVSSRPLTTGLRLAALAVNTTLYDFGDALPGGKTRPGRAVFAPFYLANNALAHVLAPLLPAPKNAANTALVALRR